MSNYVLLAVPFILMGTLLEKSKLVEDLLSRLVHCRTVSWWVGFSRFCWRPFATATGVVGASVVAMGMIFLPVMLKYGYSKELTSGVISASGTLDKSSLQVCQEVIDQMGISVETYFWCIDTGFGLACLFAICVMVIAWLKPEAAPALPPEARLLEVPKFASCKSAFTTIVFDSRCIGVHISRRSNTTEAGALGAVGL